jgi:cardiolipin synthase
MLEAIKGARKTISFETYIYWDGKVGQRFADAFSERARAGVKVHVTIDWAGSVTMDEAQLKQMENAGVEVQRYRPLHWYNLSRMNNRTHRKLLIVDGRIAFTGGVGIGDPWDGHAQDKDHWRDMHFRIEGPVVAQFQAAFNDNWIKTTGRVLNGDDNFPALQPVDGMDAQLFISSPAGGSESTHLMFLMTIAAAEHSIDLEAAYFIPDELISSALIEARRRGVRIRVIVPGKNTDSDAARHASKDGWGRCSRAASRSTNTTRPCSTTSC